MKKLKTWGYSIFIIHSLEHLPGPLGYSAGSVKADFTHPNTTHLVILN